MCCRYELAVEGGACSLARPEGIGGAGAGGPGGGGPYADAAAMTFC